MKLAAKLILVFLLGVLGIVAVSAWQNLRQQEEWNKENREAHATQLVNAIFPAVAKAYREGGQVTISRAIEVSSQPIRGSRLQLVDGEPAMTTRAREVSSITVTNPDGSRFAHSFVPLNIDGNNSGLVQVSHSLKEQDDYTRQSLYRTSFSLVAVTLLSGLVIYFVGVRLVGKPLHRLVEQVKEIGEGELDQPRLIESHDELGELSGAISQMSQRLRKQRETIRHADRLSTVGTLSAGIAHELGTPLNVVAGQAGLIAGGQLNAEEICESAKTIKEEANRMTAIIRQLLDFARQKPSAPRDVSVSETLMKTCELLEPLANKKGIQFHQSPSPEELWISGDEAQLQQVFTNLIQNAIDAMPDGGKLSVSSQFVEQGKKIQIEIADEGMGIPQDDLPRVFEPFFTTKEVGKGTGLGLSIAFGIVSEFGGEIVVKSKPGNGSTFSIILPAVPNPKDVEVDRSQGRLQS